jgi:hypothetical protein
MKAKLICIEGYWNDERTKPHNKFERRCVVMPLGVKPEQHSEILGELDDSVFYVFDEDERIVGEHMDFTVFFYTLIREIEIGETK